MYKITVQTLSSSETILYFPGNKEYTVISAVLTYEVGLAGEFNFTIPVTNPGYSNIVKNAIITVYEDNLEIWRGDIRNIKTNFDKSLKVYAVEDLAWLGDEAVAMTEVNTQTYAQRFNAVIAAYNTNQVAKRQFTVGRLTAVTSASMCTWQPEYGESVLSGLRKFIAKENGYLKVRRAYSGGVLTRYIDIVTLADYGKQSSQKVEFGTNLIDFIKDMDVTNVCNVLYPYGAETEIPLYGDIMQRLTGTPIQNDGSIALIGRRAKAVVFDTDNLTVLNNLAQSYLTRYSQANMTLEVTAADLGGIDDVDSFASGDSVRMVASVYDVDQWMYITKMDVDLLDKASNTITLCDTVRNISLTHQVTTQAAEIKELPSPLSVLEAAKDSALQILTGENGGIVTFVTNSSNQIIEMMIANNLDIDQATKAWRWNLNGLAYLHRTYASDNWTVGIAMTMDGGIVADFITTGTLDADNVNVVHLNANNMKAGTLQGQNGGSTYWNLNNNQFYLDANSYIVSSNPDYTGSTIPTNSNYPANTWTTEDLKKANIGKTYYNTNLGRMYIYGEGSGAIKITFNSNCNTESVSYDWVDIYFQQDGQYYYKRFGGSFGGQTVVLPVPNFWLYWRTDTSMHDYYGWKIDSIVSTTDSPSTFSTISSLPTDVSSWTTVSGVTSLPESAHNPYADNVREGYQFQTGLAGYGWKEATVNNYVAGTASSLLQNIDYDPTQQEIFDIITNHQQNQGLYLVGTNLYLNASMINAGQMSADRIVGGVLEIGGTSYSTNSYIRVKDSGGTQAVLINKDGIIANKGSFGSLNISSNGSKIYVTGWRDLYEEEQDGNMRRINKYVYFNPKGDGWTSQAQVNISFSCYDTGSHSTQVCRIDLQEWNPSTSKWVTSEYRRYNCNAEEMDNKDDYFNPWFQPSDNTTYRLKIYAPKKSYIQDVYLNLYLDQMDTLQISNNEIVGSFRGQMVGSAALYNLSVGGFSVTDWDDMVRLEEGTSLVIGDNSDNYYILETTSDISKKSGSSTYQVTWTSSDERIKENIKDLDVELSKQIIDGTQPKSFKYKDAEGTHYGMVAQDARKLLDSLGQDSAKLEHTMGLPESVTGLDDQRTIDYNEYIAPLINYVKDLRAEIDSLKAEIKLLKEGA